MEEKIEYNRYNGCSVVRTNEVLRWTVEGLCEACNHAERHTPTKRYEYGMDEGDLYDCLPAWCFCKTCSEIVG